MSTIKIDNRVIGNGEPTYIIAEVGVNHNGILDLALELIDAAKDAGADAVKFQKRNLNLLYAKKYLDSFNSGDKSLRYLLPILQKVELPDSAYVKIVDYCKKQKITFLCTPFDTQSADFLDELKIPAFKVASADLTNIPLIEHLIQKRKPILLSTGMSRMEEIEYTINFLKEKNAEFALLHCISTYPTAFEDINLRFMEKLRKFNVPVGYSGHERGIAVSTVASALGASIVERHITLDRTMVGPDHASSLEPSDFARLVRHIRHVAIALGSGEEKYLNRGEILNREVMGKSLYSTRSIHNGEKITRDMITIKGPALGISPQRLPDLLGRISTRDIMEDEPFFESDLIFGTNFQLKCNLPLRWGFAVRFGDFKELLVYNPKLVEFHLTDEDLKMPFECGDFDLELIVHAPEFWDSNLVDLCSSDQQKRKDSVALIQKSIDFTRFHSKHFRGKPKVIVHPGAMSIDHPIKDIPTLYQNLELSIANLDYGGVELLLENLPPRPWYFGGQWLTNAFMDAHEIRDFLLRNNLNMCFDTSHSKLYSNYARVDFFEQIKVLLPFIHHLHLSDGAAIDGEGLQIGEGTIDWVRFFRTIEDYSNTLIPEIWRGHQRKGEGFMIALQRLSQAYQIVNSN